MNTYIFAKLTKGFELVESWVKQFDCDLALDAYLTDLKTQNPEYIIKCDEYDEFIVRHECADAMLKARQE